jgi:hypothetical protein
MKNICTQNRSLDSLTKDEVEQLDFMVARLQANINKGTCNADGLGHYAKMMYNVVYPRTVRKQRHFTGRQLRVISALKAGY